MGVITDYLKDQFRLKKFKLEHDDASQFHLSCWQSNRSSFPLLCVRLILFLGTIAIVTTSLSLRYEDNVGFWFIYMTNWGILYIMVACGLAFAVSARSYFKGPIDSSFGLPWYLKLYWGVYNSAICVAFFITIFYYSLLYNAYDLEDIPEDLSIELYPTLDLFVHGINSVLMFVLLMTSQHPSHMLHFTFPVAFAIVYMVFSIIYYYSGGLDPNGNAWIYPVLDWGNPGLSTGLVFGCAALLVFLHWFVVLLSLLRNYLARKLVGDFNKFTLA